jgi:kinesin family protein 3/17
MDTEIRDLRYENDRDREDMLSTIKELTKENKLYAGLVRMILTENEIKRITDLCQWKEDNEEWKIQPFSFKEKKLNFPSIKPYNSKQLF